MSHVMRKLIFCICENKGADHLHCNHAGDVISAFIFASLIYFLILKFHASAIIHPSLCRSLVGNYGDRFSHEATHMITFLI